MDFARRMVLVPEHMFHPSDTVKILNDDTEDDTTKVRRYGRALKTLKTRNKELRAPLDVKTEKAPTLRLTEENITEDLPLPLRVKGKKLLKSLQGVTWNDLGELIYKGQAVPESYMGDLLQDALRKDKNFEPIGWQRFAEAMADSNVPGTLLGNRERRGLVQRWRMF